MVAIILVLVGAIIGRITTPTKLKETEKIVYKERKESNRQIKERVTTGKDGVVVIEKDIIERIIDNKDRTETRKREESKSKSVSIALYALKLNTKAFSEPAYGAHVQKEILPNISVGILADTSKNFGVSVGIAF